nr:MAG TPA: Protein of unknown function (DUF3046) [Caudoviricetes sp.]
MLALPPRNQRPAQSIRNYQTHRVIWRAVCSREARLHG